MMKTITPATATAVPCTPHRMIVVTTDWMVVVEDDEDTTKENDENHPTTADAMRFATDPVIPVGSPLLLLSRQNPPPPLPQHVFQKRPRRLLRWWLLSSLWSPQRNPMFRAPLSFVFVQCTCHDPAPVVDGRRRRHRCRRRRSRGFTTKDHVSDRKTYPTLAFHWMRTILLLLVSLLWYGTFHPAPTNTLDFPTSQYDGVGHYHHYRYGEALSFSPPPPPRPPLPWQDRTPLKVAFVTGNAMKAREVENIVEEHCYNNNNDYYTEMDDIRSDDTEDYSNRNDENDTDDDDDTCALLQLDLTVTSINLPEIQEVDTMAIAKQKAILAAQLVNGPCVVEDTSLEFHALGGMPGPYIKWFQETLKSQGLYNILAAYDNKNATAKCTLAFIPAPHADPILFTGVCHGHIVAPQPKMYGFGWDTIFVPNEYTIPFSQMNMATKNLVSHRGHAVRQWADWLGQNQDVLLERQQSTSTTTFLGHQGLTFKIRPNKLGPDDDDAQNNASFANNKGQ